MKRAPAISTVLVAAVFMTASAAWGQRGAAGGHVGGGVSTPRSFSMAPATSARSFSAPSFRSAPTTTTASHGLYSSPIGSAPFGGTQPISGNHGGGGWGNGHGGGRYPSRGYRGVYAPGSYLIPSYIGYGYYGYGDDSGYSDQQQAAPAYPDLNAQAASALPDDGSRQAYADQPERPPYPPQGAAEVPDQPAITLLFKDGRSPQQVQNYAVTRTTLYVFDGAKRREIPLNDLDLPQTEKTNRDAGLDFQIPDGAE